MAWNIIKGLNKDQWIEKFKAAQQENISLKDFKKLNGLQSGGTWIGLKTLINDDSLTNLAKHVPIGPNHYAKRGPKPGPRKPKDPSYQKMLLPEVVEKVNKNERPIFCLVVGFESKEAAFKALGQL